MFKVKATVFRINGDEKKYPCHFNYKIGDEIIWDGERMTGRICPAVLTQLSAKMYAMYAAGPRYCEPGYYLPFWYAPVSEYDPEMKKYDGIGFRNCLKTIEEPQYHMAHLRPANSFKWPPHPERTVNRGIFVTCGDLRTAVTLKLEVIDLADHGDCITYFRRMMSILDKVQKNPGVAADKVLGLFTKKEIETAYPALSEILVSTLLEELELVGHIKIEKGKVTLTKKGEQKIKDFKASLTPEEKKALKM